MNLTVDQMDVINFRLTEVSLELLGNNFYDIFGRKCDTLGTLYKSKTGSPDTDIAADSDLLKALNIEDIFGSNASLEETRGVVKSQQNIQNASCDPAGLRSERSSESEADVEVGNTSRENKITKIINEVDEEYSKLMIHSESNKMKYFITNKYRMETDNEDEYEICNRFHTEENARLMAQSDAFIKLIKYIKCDSRNAFKMGEIAANILKVKDHLSETAKVSN